MDLFSKNIGYQGIFFHTIVQFVYSEWSGHHIFILSLQRGQQTTLAPNMDQIQAELHFISKEQI